MNNRERFPGFGEFVDELRAVFGPVKVRFVRNLETGDVAGKPRIDGTAVIASGSQGNVTGYQREQQRIKDARAKPKGRVATTRYR